MTNKTPETTAAALRNLICENSAISQLMIYSKDAHFVFMLQKILVYFGCEHTVIAVDSIQKFHQERPRSTYPLQDTKGEVPIIVDTNLEDSPIPQLTLMLNPFMFKDILALMPEAVALLFESIGSAELRPLSAGTSQNSSPVDTQPSLGQRLPALA